MPFYIEELIDYNCGLRDNNKSLYIDSFPKRCSSIQDCLLQDKTYADCSCSLDGMTYCTASKSSSEFDAYWTSCSSGTMNVDTEIIWWTIYEEFYEYTLGRPACADALIWEFSYMTELVQNLASTLLSLGLLWVSYVL